MSNVPTRHRYVEGLRSRCQDIHADRRRGLTRIDLLVTLLAIGLVLAVVLPATQQVRNQSTKSICQDNLHNIAIAALNYETGQKSLPPGWIDQRAFGSNWSWNALLLPYMEQKSLYIRIGAAGPGSLADALGRPELRSEWQQDSNLHVLHCPWNTGPTSANPARELTDLTGATHTVTLSHYVGNHGPDWSLRSDGSPYGCFGRNSHVRLSNISDGVASTILFGERAWHLAGDRNWYGGTVVPWAQCDAALVYGIGGDGTQAFQHDTLAIGEPGINNRTRDARSRFRCREGFGGPHPGGAQFATGDGKVTYLNEGIAPTVFRRLLDRADGMAQSLP